MNIIGFTRHRVAALTLAASMSAAATSGPAHAANFFEQLFGGGAPTSSPAPTYRYNPPMPDALTSGTSAPLEFRRRKSVEFRREDAKPTLQKPTDLMHDRTLHTGDAVMMKGGIHIYAGRETARHTSNQFVALDEARVSPKERKDLVAMDVTRLDPLANASLQEGRSGSGSTPRTLTDAPPITQGYKITDMRGKSVRYVGP